MAPRAPSSGTGLRAEPASLLERRRDDILAAVVAGVPYARFLGIGFERRGDELTARLAFDDKLIGNPMVPAIHGGVTAAFLEVTAILALGWRLLLPAIDAHDIDPGQVAAGRLPRLPRTIDFSVNYLRPGLPRDAFARAVICRMGRRFSTVRVEAWQDQRDRPFAQAAGHFRMPKADVPDVPDVAGGAGSGQPAPVPRAGDG